MKISVVVPAFNEEKLLGACIASVRSAFAAIPGQNYEVVVCDNNSSDGTAAVAAACGARVVFEPVNMISLSRNTGAAAASGDWLLFVDADSELSRDTLRAAAELMRSGRVIGGGAVIGFTPAPPLWGRLLTCLWNLISRSFRLAAGSFLFCRADDFRAVGGFSPVLYAAEEIDLSRALGRRGRAKGQGFEIITSAPHLSSGRKFSLYGTAALLGDGLSFAIHPCDSARSRNGLRVFYDGRR